MNKVQLARDPLHLRHLAEDFISFSMILSDTLRRLHFSTFTQAQHLQPGGKEHPHSHNQPQHMSTSYTVNSPTVTATTTTTSAGNRTTMNSNTTTTTTESRTTPAYQQPSGAPRMSQLPPSDHAPQHEMGHGYGEDISQHLQHSSTAPVHHWGLTPKYEERLFYCFAVPSWCFNIAAGIIGSYYDTSIHEFIICAAIFQALSWAAWWQTAAQMLQRASWVRDEGNLPDRRRFLHLAVRLQRLMLVCFPLSSIL